MGSARASIVGATAASASGFPDPKETRASAQPRVIRSVQERRYELWSPYGAQDLVGGVGEWTACAADAPDCIGVIHSNEHYGVAGLRTYAATPIAQDSVLDFLHAGFRCARD